MLELANITKRFGANLALDDVSLAFHAGEITALVGENGAGKTTLMRIAAGELAADAGTIARAGAVELVHQHFMLVGDFTIAENLALTMRGFRIASRATIERVVEETGIALGDLSRRADELSVGEKAKLELVKAIAKKPRVLILDEPTSVLTPHESQELFRVMRTLASSGTAVIFISHKLPEVLDVAERVVVMRGGRVAAAGTLTAAEIVAAASGSPTSPPSDSRTPARPRPAPAIVRAQQLRGETLTDATFEIRAGETVAIVGVAGNGQAELAAMIRGLAKPRGGTLAIDAARTGHIPEDRTRDGIVAEMSIAENLALRGNRDAARSIAQFSIRARGPRQRAGDLSGGNQQKVILARELHGDPELIVAAEPTRGLDLDATAYVHEQLRAAAARGAAILLITSDLDEALGLADGIHVIYRGRLSARLGTDEAAARVGALMAGLA